MKIKFNLLKVILTCILISSNLYSQNEEKQLVENDSLNGIFAEFETEKGIIIAKLEYKIAPVAVANFITLAEGTNEFITDEKLKGIPFYDGLKFHLVVQDYMIKSGDPTGLGNGGTGYTINGDFSTELRFEKGGYLAMDNSEFERDYSSQFFITHRNTEWFLGEKTIFGKIITDLDVVKSINQNDKLIKVTIKRVGEDAENFDAVAILTEYLTVKKPIEDAEIAERRRKFEAEQAETKAKIKAIMDKEKEKEKAIADEKAKVAKAKKIIFFNEMKAKAIKTPSGLKYVIIEKGNGKKPINGQTVYIHYAEYLTDATLSNTNFEDVAREYGRFEEEMLKRKVFNPFPYKLGQKEQLIPGILEGISKMSYGDKILLFIPSKLAYGTEGSGSNVPSNTDIISEIQLLKSPPTN